MSLEFCFDELDRLLHYRFGGFGHRGREPACQRTADHWCQLHLVTARYVLVGGRQVADPADPNALLRSLMAKVELERLSDNSE